MFVAEWLSLLPSDSELLPPMSASTPEDSVLKSARREAVVVLTVWAAALVYTVGVCYRLGYGRAAESLRFVYGFPDWVFWGIVAPWLACLAITAWFALRFMTDDDLGEDEPDEEPLPGAAPGGDRFAAYLERRRG